MPTHTITTGTNTQTLADAIFDAVFEKSHHFRIDMEFDDICQFIRRIGGYNEFEAATVLEALERVDQLIPKKFYNAGNPNNGERSYTLSIGREGSPILHLTRYEWGVNSPLDDETMKAVCREMELIGKADQSDFEVFDLGAGRKVTFRFWWD